MAHIEDDIRTGELGTMANKQYTTTMSLTIPEMILLQTILSLHKKELNERLGILKDEDMRRINQEWLDRTKSLIEKVDQANMSLA